MASEVDAAQGPGKRKAGDNSLSCRERAGHYRRYAAEMREIAESKPAGAIRDQLLILARQYEALARMVGRPRGGRAAKRAPSGKRKASKRERLAEPVPS